MQASETKLQPMIEGTKQYIVPLYQRPYSWDKKEWQVLWDDLVWLYENEEPKNHFIGSIVTFLTSSVPEGVTKFMLIDGQQRLTTIFILLALLRDVAKTQKDDQLAAEIEETQLVNRFKKGNDYFKLLPTQDDRNSFMGLIQSSHIDATTPNRIMLAYQFFEREVRRSGIDVTLLTRIISSRLSVVSILLNEEDNPNLVFESLNAKGKPLTQSDLIRNYFLMRIHVDAQAEVHQQYWKPMQDILGEDLTEYIRHYLMKTGSVVKQSDVYFTLKERIKGSDALGELKNLALFAQYYARLVHPDTEPHNEIRTALGRLKRLEVTTIYPFLLSAYHDYTQNISNAGTFLDILRTIENYLVRRFICNMPTGGLNKIFPFLYEQATLEGRGDLASGIRRVLQTKGYPRNSEFGDRFANSRLYGEGERRPKAKLILDSIEASFHHKEQPDLESATIEHIMPQSLTDDWKHMLGDNWQEYELYLHTAGNLTLTAYNPELSNKSFAEKKAYFASSHFEMNRYFQNSEQWDKDAIESRSNTLAELAMSIWPYFGDERDSSRAVLGNVTNRTPARLIIYGQSYDVDSWRIVQELTLNTIYKLDPKGYRKLRKQFSRAISDTSDRMREPKKLQSGDFVEQNRSARDIYRFCLQAIQTVGLSNDDWNVELS